MLDVLHQARELLAADVQQAQVITGLEIDFGLNSKAEHRLSLVGAMVAAAAQAATAEVGGLSAAQSQLRGDGSRLNLVENN